MGLRESERGGLLGEIISREERALESDTNLCVFSVVGLKRASR